MAPGLWRGHKGGGFHIAALVEAGAVGGIAAFGGGKAPQPPLFRGEGDHEVVEGCWREMQGITAGRLDLMHANGGSDFSGSPLRLASLATSPIDGGG